MKAANKKTLKWIGLAVLAIGLAIFAFDKCQAAVYAYQEGRHIRFHVDSENSRIFKGDEELAPVCGMWKDMNPEVGMNAYRVEGESKTIWVYVNYYPENLAMVAYPNPVFGILNINKSPDQIAYIYGPGFSVATKENQFDTSSIPPGLFVVKANNRTAKIMKQ